MIDVGDQVTSLKLALSDGSILNLADPGGPLILYFYPKHRNVYDVRSRFGLDGGFAVTYVT